MRLAKDGTLARFTLRLNLFVERRSMPGDLLSEPVIDFAMTSLNRLHRRLLRRGRGFRSQSPVERHALRIAVKRMRYAAEFFGNLFRPHSVAERGTLRRRKHFSNLLGQPDDKLAIALKLINTWIALKMWNFRRRPGMPRRWVRA